MMNYIANKYAWDLNDDIFGMRRADTINCSRGGEMLERILPQVGRSLHHIFFM